MIGKKFKLKSASEAVFRRFGDSKEEDMTDGLVVEVIKFKQSIG